ncbi:MAG: RagB/SusD family nutrient uptake outer membrane protein [Bacteroidetes bacterium]|uniref:RagB/SusD family nutrient uptake outer membrane protein n=1 Tax=unclassified Chitinophaga TaxID=2619133 RepID=UPI0009CB08E4|nr:MULTISPECIES: RagB/SusD family nutrient uptake outer membrane protein [unclassified Chitinophaga]MBP1652487.1 RagB/SusD family nutrient uptake outer membrane protein [Bacteroidota bacterium]OMP75272.1 RagB/SusD family nutrient uptake outer membrane protein [[Flexibacter] sp. ATCC 35208]OMP75839.1 RagB/SusD family nutrient uptake outer membrane protein [[Flexibacter] sp. ATCC 35208]WPV66127.1 RagB/SusD family nutrient uptake outer membrane protein [Chitinophaga sp. LS1]
MKTIISLLTVFLLTSCSKDFFNGTPQDGVTVDAYYKTDAQVTASTNALYSVPWFGWVGKAGLGISELSSGNARSYSSDVINFQDWTATNVNAEVVNAWNSLFTVVAQCNAVIKNLNEKASSSVSTDVLNNALGEAHLMRALAYFHLVRIFGAVPIIEDYTEYISNYKVHRNLVTDVYKFILIDLEFAEKNCYTMTRSSSYSSQGRVSSGSASALMAKVYLYMQDYTNARAKAEKVISSGEFRLYGADVTGVTFNDLFKTANNNNEESVIQLQWATNATYGQANPAQSLLAYTTTISGFGDGWGVLSPTFDLLDMYDDGDARKHATVMVPGDTYSEIHSSDGGFTVGSDCNPGGTHTGTKKYVVGNASDNGGVGGSQAMPNNTYMMRYSDVLLIYAEAIMAGASSSSDATALAALNKVRNRSGLTSLTQIKRGYYTANAAYNATTNPNAPTTLYRDDILDERRREFAFEDDFWYDLGRIDGYNATAHPLAILLIKQQDRGTSDNSTVPVRYGNGYLTPTNDDFLFPIPAVEITANPLLSEAPVAYDF